MLKKMLFFLFFPFSAAFRFVVLVFRLLFFKNSTTVDVFYDALEPQDSEISCNNTRVQSVVFNLHEATTENVQFSFVKVKDSWLNEYLYSDHYNTSLSNVVHNDQYMSETLLQPDDHRNDTTSFPFSFVDQSVDLELSHESIVVTQDQFIQETDDSENSSDPPNSCNSNLLEDMLIISPVSNFDSNDSLSGANMLVDLDYLPSFCSSDSPTGPLKQHLDITSVIEDNTDPFHQKYSSRMRFFNILYHERLHGMNVIMNEHLSNKASTDLPIQFTLWSKVARKRILRSLECDLEMIYVAQSCLFWEALHHQYHKVEALTFSENIVVFDHVVSGKFQELEILLERFVEDQKCECQRSSINTHQRLSFQAFLQVPDATGFIFMEQENKMMMREEGIRPTQLLDSINNCIKAFLLYITTDHEKKSLWKYTSIWRTHPPVEDPMDLELLYEVTKTLHKKGIMLKDVQGKSKCWLRRKVKPLETEDEKRSLVFAMIDMKLVQRLLKMSLVSKSHLKWCQEKLNNLDFKEGRVYRGCIGHLFPYS